MHSLRIGPLLVDVAICVLFALFGTALIGESLGTWYGALEKPWFLIPLCAFGIVGAIYYVLFATVLYRILVHADDHRGRITSLVLTIIVLFLNELWNFGFFGLGSTLVGFLGIAVFFGSPYGTSRSTSQLRTVLSGTGRRLLDMGTL